MQFNGKKLFEWTIEFAKTLEYPIYLTTDAELKIEGCITIPRPSHLVGDIHMEYVVDHATKSIKEDNIILLQVTTPLRKRETLTLCIDAFNYHKKGIITINPCTYKPDGRYYIFEKDKYIWNHPIHVIFPLPVTSNFDVIDIDYIWDFRIAEAIGRGDYS